MDRLKIVAGTVLQRACGVDDDIDAIKAPRPRGGVHRREVVEEPVVRSLAFGSGGLRPTEADDVKAVAGKRAAAGGTDEAITSENECCWHGGTVAESVPEGQRAQPAALRLQGEFDAGPEADICALSDRRRPSATQASTGPRRRGIMGQIRRRPSP